jgi:hypothetical protein
MNTTRNLVLLVALLGAGACDNKGNGGGGDMGPSGCVMFEGVCLAVPSQVAQRTRCGDVTDFCDPAGAPAPNLSCLATPKPPMGGPATVTVSGFVDVFSSGPDSDGVSIAFYDAAPLLAGMDIAQATPLAMVNDLALDLATPDGTRACDALAKNGCVLPSRTGCMVPVCNDGLDARSDDKRYCRDNGGGNFQCEERLRWEAAYTLPVKLPTNQQLVVRVTGPNGMANQKWANLVTWNVYFPSDARACKDKLDYDCLDNSDLANPRYQYNVNALSRGDYVNIPTTAGLSGGISAGKGAAAGEIHDCDNVRVEYLSVGVTPMADRFSYFNGNPLRTLPDSGRVSTDRLGLFAALNLPPGKVKVVAAGLTQAGGMLTSFGSFEAYVYPDTVSVLNVNGGKPKP